MKISEVISLLKESWFKFGDAELYTEKDDGRSTWISPFKPELKLDKQKRLVVEERDY